MFWEWTSSGKLTGAWSYRPRNSEAPICLLFVNGNMTATAFCFNTGFLRSCPSVVWPDEIKASKWHSEFS